MVDDVVQADKPNLPISPESSSPEPKGMAPLPPIPPQPMKFAPAEPEKLDEPTYYPSFLQEPMSQSSDELEAEAVLPPVLPPESEDLEKKEEVIKEEVPEESVPPPTVPAPPSFLEKTEEEPMVSAPVIPEMPAEAVSVPENIEEAENIETNFPNTENEAAPEVPVPPSTISATPAFLDDQEEARSEPIIPMMPTATDEPTPEPVEASESEPRETEKESEFKPAAEEPTDDAEEIVDTQEKTEAVSDDITEPDLSMADASRYTEVAPLPSGEDGAYQNKDYKSASFLEDLFANENACVTVPNGTFPVKDETRALLALFSNGRFFVAESAKFDGKVLGFEYLARRRHLQIGQPEYVPSIVINDIYEYAAKNAVTRVIAPVVEGNSQEQVRMQRDFVTIISRAAAYHVSDIHIVVADHTTVMFRVNGLMQTEMEYNKEWGESFVRAAFASADISDANYAQNEYQAAQKLGRTPLRGSNGKLNLPRNVLGIRLQFNPIAFGTRYVVMRLLYADADTNAASDLEALGFTKKETDIFYQMRSIPTGMIIISGPTGSGKSTTLQRNMIAMLQERKYEINLITVEDPPEYPIPGARQMPVTNADVEEAKEREFTKALSAALRSDPDALMIGEIRTLSAADLAFRGALSGHNVWTTLHANSAPAILMRLKDVGVEDFKLQDPSIMKGLMAQRLFRKVCPNCCIKASSQLDHPAVQRLRRAFGDVALEHCYLRGSGCETCDFRGVKGRTVVAEFIQPDATFLNLSIQGESKKALNYWINDLGGMTLRESALSRMLQGIIDIEEVERWTGFLDQQVMA